MKGRARGSVIRQGGGGEGGSHLSFPIAPRGRGWLTKYEVSPKMGPGARVKPSLKSDWNTGGWHAREQTPTRMRKHLRSLRGISVVSPLPRVLTLSQQFVRCLCKTVADIEDSEALHEEPRSWVHLTRQKRQLHADVGWIRWGGTSARRNVTRRVDAVGFGIDRARRLAWNSRASAWCYYFDGARVENWDK